MFNDPFRYAAHPLVVEAAEDLMHRLEGWSRLEPGSERYEFEKALAQGKMLGVLVVQDAEGKTSYLAGFSGNVNGRSSFEGFVPPVFDLLDPKGHFKIKEAELTEINRQIAVLEDSPEFSELKAALGSAEADRDRELKQMKAEMALAKSIRDGIRSETEDSSRYAELIRQSQFQKAELRRKKVAWEERIQAIEEQVSEYSEKISLRRKDRAARSDELQKWIFDRYIVSNAEGSRASIGGIFAQQGLIPPGGTGECAAPKLLNHAFNQGLSPVAMGEFWYGHSPETAVRTHGHFYPSCTSRCAPLLTFMLKGLEIEKAALPEAPSLELLHEDEHILAVVKPSGIPSVPGLDGKISVQEILSARYGSGIQAVHRLDMDTSGILLFAKDPASALSLRRQFEERTVRKSYLARLSPQESSRFVKPLALKKGESGKIELPLSPDYDERPRQKVDRAQGKPALSEYKVLSIKPDGSIDILFRPHTGRTHQLRLHAAHQLGLGRPIIGDLLYGGAPAERLYLHACGLSFTHPVTGESLSLTSKAPFASGE